MTELKGRFNDVTHGSVHQYLLSDPSGVGTEYIDGGLGANCPAKQGIELAKER